MAFVGILAVLPAANAAGIAVGDVVVVNGPVPTVFTCAVNALGARSWVQSGGGAGQPAAFPVVSITPGAPASASMTISGSVVDSAGAPVDSPNVAIVVTGTAANLNSAVAASGSVADVRDLSPTTSQVIMQCTANGLFSVTLGWGASEPATQLVTCGPFALATGAAAFP